MKDRILADCLTAQPPLTLAATATVLDAARLMAARRCGSILVVASDGALTGIFTERDLLNKVVAAERPPAATRVEEVMTPAPRTAQPTMPVTHALVLMRDGGFRHLPVVDPAGKVLGMFSIRDTLTRELADADRIADHHEHLGGVL